jgi:hypothetical protein
MTKIIKGDLLMKENMIFTESLIVEGNIFGKNGGRFNLFVKGDLNCLDLNCWDLTCRDLNCWNLTSRDLNCKGNINYYAVCFAYRNIKCKSIKGRRENCKHFVLDGGIIINGVKQKK